jgi:hypothetical protein
VERLRVVLLLCAWRIAATAAQPSPIDQAFNRFYNFDPPGANAILDDYVARQHQDPLGHIARSATYLFSELTRLQILESGFFIDDYKLIDKKKLKPDPEIRLKFFAAVNEGQQLARDRLAAQPEDRNALFSMCIANGLVADYNALIDKRQWNGLGYAKRSQTYAVRLLKLDPTFYDAYLTTGVSEYLVGSLPFFLRWFVHFDQVQGSKSQAVQNLKLVARSGRYFRPFAKILLAIVYLREGNPWQSQTLLGELAQEFPNNPLYRKELDKISERLRNTGHKR